MSKTALSIAISTGDLNGIGIEVILKSFEERALFDAVTPIVYGHKKALEFYASRCDLAADFHQISDAAEAKSGCINVIQCWEENVEIEPGVPTKTSGKCALDSLTRATQDLVSGKVQALVTAPIDKDNIQSDSFKFPGHTEFLAKQAGSDSVLMFLVSEMLRVGVVTGHVPISKVSNLISEERILDKLAMMHHSLKKDFGIDEPKIAVLGLNPHAGDNGLIGSEDGEIITPCLQKAKEQGICAEGPFPADGLFGSRAYKNFDATLAMYHDQGLVPFKTIAFEKGVNFTAGLPIVRTSPDHGTAFDIAGKNLASPASFIRAIHCAHHICTKRAN
jgi:4-hydroxythreonine-4-phosphate dehydrogenase